MLGAQRALNIAGPLLRSTWSAIRGWRALQPVRSRVPLSRMLLQALLITSLARGNAESGRTREIWWSSMLACWLCFEGLLRPGELRQLRVADVDLPMGGWEAGMILTIRKPKTRRICRTNVSLMRWMSWWMQGFDPGRRVFRMGRRLWANMFSLGLSCVGAADKGFTLGSLPGGGATHHFRVHENLGRLQYHGRCARSETLRCYLHEALAAQVDARLSSESRRLVESVLAHLHVLDRPPPRSLKVLLSRSGDE